MGPGARRAALILIAVISVNASYTVLIPFVPDLEDRVGAGPAVIALTFALFAAAKALGQPVGGWWADRWRPNTVACLSLLLAAGSIVLTALARDAVTLLAGRVCWGVAEGLVSPALYAGMAALCQRYGISTSRMMGNFSSAAVAGFLLGPLVAGLAAPMDLETLFVVGAVLTAVTALGLLRAIPAASPAAPQTVAAQDVAAQTAVPQTAEPAAAAAGADRPGGGAAGRWWVWVLALGALDLFTSLVYTALEPVLPLYLSAGQPGSARAAISVVFVVGLAVSAVTMWALGRYTARLRLLTLIGAGLALLAAGLSGLAIRADLLPVAAWFVLLMVGYAVLFLTARRGIVELRSASTHQGKAFGLFGMVSDVGNILGPVVGTVLYELTGRLSFVLLGALSGLLLAALLTVAGRRRGVRVPAHPPARAEAGARAGKRAA